MKIVSAKEMGRIERLAYDAGASEEDFMNRAGQGVAEVVQRYIALFHIQPKITLLCGSGNNAGDAYVAGRILLEGGFRVHALAFAPFEKSSPLCQLQTRRFKEMGGKVDYIADSAAINFSESEILVDGLLGTGFHGEVEGLLRAAIEKANASGLPLIAIDIPSGINGTTGEIGSVAIHASATLFLGLPKIGCLFPKAWNFVGKMHIYNFGLEQRFIDEADADYLLIEEDQIGALLPKIERTRHKYQAGYVVGVGGSSGMPGAPLMTSFAALRAGAGIVRLLHPEEMRADFAPYEVIRQAYREGDTQAILEAMKRASVIFVGPGMGTSAAALQILQGILPQVDKPCVIDAEALTLLSEHEITLPSQTILTPHQGEMLRLLHMPKDLPFAELLKQCQAYVDRKKVTLILKGAPTFIFHPGSKPMISPRGDPGMATAGSGDVLTGIVAAFLAQTQDPLKAAILGVYLHAVAGEYAAEKWTSYCMVATDITDALPLAFKDFLDKK